jgi:SAM-dependent methyltransferase
LPAVPGTRRQRCALCGAPERKHLFDKDGYPIARCRSCRLVQVDVELSRDELERIYGEDFFTEEELFHDYVAQRDIRVASGARFADVIARIVPGGRLLDVGAAAGFFLEAASRHYDVTGVEFSPFAAEHARTTFGHRVLTGDVTEVDLAGEQFDVATMWATIEHMADPLAAVTAVASLTRPGGLLVLSTGDVTGPLARLDLRDWNLMLPPYHLFFFSPRTIEVLFAKAGFRLRRIIYDGVVATRGPLATKQGHWLSTLLGLGNVMTVYATREPSPPQPSPLRRIDARYRPLSLAFR